MCNRRAFYKNRNHHQSSKFENHRGHRGRKFWKEKFKATFNQPPANVQELDDQYVLFLYAPGLEKKDFLIATLDDTLSISVEKQSGEDIKWKREEYAPGGFKRQFELNEKIDKTAIKAKYEQGVLIITLPKLEGFETNRQDIEVV